MGLAASQARFLGLTARKSNVEYNVQQINQARVALSNEVMGLYDEYNKLQVPTPPVVNDYMKTTYTLDSAYEDYQIENFVKIGIIPSIPKASTEIDPTHYTQKDTVCTEGRLRYAVGIGGIPVIRVFG